MNRHSLHFSYKHFLLIFTCFIVVIVNYFLQNRHAVLAQYEQINSFSSDITVQPDATILVTETIEYDFGNQQRHGIYRTIPIVYSNQDGKKYQAEFDLNSVTDEFGNGYSYTTSKTGDDIQIKIGDPDRTITGEYTYIINYSMKGPIQYYSDHDELYWNVTGNEWDVPIQTSSATVSFVPAIQDSIFPQSRSICFAGSVGSDTEYVGSFNEFQSSGKLYSVHSETLSPYEGMTIAVSFPSGILTPYQMKEATDYSWIYGIATVVYFIVGYLLLPIGLIFWWWIRGRDPKISSVVVRQYDPPKKDSRAWLTPVEVGVLVDETIQPRDISAAIISLAIRHYIVIKESPRKLGGLLKGEIEFIQGDAFKNDPDLVKISEHEKLLIQAIGLDTKANVKVNSLGNEFARKLQKLKDKVYADMVTEGYFPENPKKVKSIYVGIGVFMLIVGNIIIAILLFILSRVMGRRTLKGAQAKSEAMGLLKFLKSQERHYAFQEGRAMLFEKLLPYAIVFGVAKVWAEKFNDIADYKPDWYQSSDRTFSPVLFTSTLNSTLNSVQSAYTPTSTSSSSGFRSGFSGGGFSGGGFGGGGGGSW